MTFVVTESCIKCKLTDCVEVCPVDCFHEGPNMLVIDPDECIDCTLCEPECPVEAIYSEDELPAGQEHFLELNTELSQRWPVITEMKGRPRSRMRPRAALVLAICSREKRDSCIRAPPEAANRMNGDFRSTARNIPAITASPAAIPKEPAMKRKSWTAATHF